MQKLKLAYFGSPLFSADLLEKIILDKSLPVEVALVVTQPDKPVGRKQIITPSPVKIVAQKYNLNIWNKPLLQIADSQLTQIDLAIVYAYGFKELIPLNYLQAPQFQFDIGEGKRSGFINIHPSLLPLYRGSSPIAYPILLGDKQTGVTLFVMDEKMDHGPIISQEKIVINPNNMRFDMEKKLTTLGFKMIKKSLIMLSEKKQPISISQKHNNATRAPYMIKDSGFISLITLSKMIHNKKIAFKELPDIMQNYFVKYPNENKKLKNENSLPLLFNLFRGLSPWPGLWTLIRPDFTGSSEGHTLLTREVRLKITEMKIVDDKPTITKVQLEGKNPVDMITFNRVYPFIFPTSPIRQ